MRTKGCQVDYLIQTKSGVLYICEVKFTRNAIGYDIIDEMQHKIEQLSLPRYTSVIPALIHIGDIRDNVIDAQYFSKVINLEQLLK